MARKTCPQCGRSFSCEGDKDCWCEEVQLHRAQMQLILERYTGCICPDCMKAYEAKE